MAAPKPKLSKLPEDVWELPADDEPVEFDERRWEELLQMPGVIVHRWNEELAKQFKPLKTTGTMSMAELRWLLGRIDDEELEAERRAAADHSTRSLRYRSVSRFGGRVST